MIYYPTYIAQSKYITNQEIVDFRIKVIQFAEQYGLAATLSAFNLSRATLYAWRKRLKDNGGKFEYLAPTSTRPHVYRTSKLDTWYYEQILELRRQHPRLGKAKLKPILNKRCQLAAKAPISESTIGRIVAQLKTSGKLPKYIRMSVNGASGKINEYSYARRIKKQRRGGYTPKAPGDLVQIDCITKFINGIKRYVISAIDYQTSFAYSYVYKSLSSTSSTDFWLKLRQVAPFEIKHVQTDNGQEFHKHFYRTLQEQGLTHFFNYPRTPKSNGKIERYNRSIQDEFVDYSLQDMAYDLDSFNRQLATWLVYYNTERPHYSHRSRYDRTLQIPPLKAYIDMLQLSQLESSMCWTHTAACK